MAKAGIYISEVRKARDALLAQGKRPSVDAVRIALGNTGSKTTIHKYLKELEAEEGAAGGRKASISDALQDLVERLAARLQEEADGRIETLRAEHAERERQQAAALSAARAEAEQWRTQCQHAEAALAEEQQAHAGTREALQQEHIARHAAEQRSAALLERLTDKEVHCASLEDKHRHAYEALEHYRQSVKEQREQDARRHEQQVQQLQAELRTAQQTIIVRQDDVTRLNREGARLITELSQARQTLHESEERGRRYAIQLEALRGVEQRNDVLTAQLADSERQAATLDNQIATLSERARGLEIALAAANARNEGQQGLVAELRAFLVARERQADAKGAVE
ncbi:DNA-binding protein [Massilia horti]|uniref:DNA-binding protein n=1 Tax=Massilia horti TaxID=2562153 RepID=A0A4Y9SZ65_9BURK|nr:DNA-binding protein [Massilia horti]TFW31752.1 DNA-binding protein [Massilia horti]